MRGNPFFRETTRRVWPVAVLQLVVSAVYPLIDAYGNLRKLPDDDSVNSIQLYDLYSPGLFVLIALPLLLTAFLMAFSDDLGTRRLTVRALPVSSRTRFTAQTLSALLTGAAPCAPGVLLTIPAYLRLQRSHAAFYQVTEPDAGTIAQLTLISLALLLAAGCVCALACVLCGSGGAASAVSILLGAALCLLILSTAAFPGQLVWGVLLYGYGPSGEFAGMLAALLLLSGGCFAAGLLLSGRRPAERIGRPVVFPRAESAVALCAAWIVCDLLVPAQSALRVFLTCAVAGSLVFILTKMALRRSLRVADRRTWPALLLPLLPAAYKTLLAYFSGAA